MLLVHYGFGYWFDPTYMLVLIGLCFLWEHPRW